MDQHTADTSLHKAFIVTVIMNGIVAIFDIGAGFFFLYKPLIDSLLLPFILRGGTAARFALSLEHLSERIQIIGAFYFFSHGAVKLFLTWGLLQKRLWAYPASMIFLGLFSVYQLFDMLRNYSAVVFAFLLFNILVIVLIYKEYKRVRATV